MGLILAWLNRDLWSPIWPNLAASAICAFGVWAKLHYEQAEHRRALEHHVSATAEGIKAHTEGQHSALAEHIESRLRHHLTPPPLPPAPASMSSAYPPPGEEVP
jgi:hypothetical protein